MPVVNVNGTDVLKIRKVASGLPYAADSKMADKTYSRFVFGGKVFICNDDDVDFSTAVSNGTLHEVDLDTDDDGQLSLAGFITKNQIFNQTMFNKKIELVATAKYAELAADPKFVAA